MKKLGMVLGGVKSKSKVGKVFQRAALFFVIAILGFGIFEPGVSYVLALENANREFKLDYDLKPLKSEKQGPVESSIQDGQPVAPDSLTRQIENPRGHRYEDVSKRTAYSSTYVNNDGTRSLNASIKQQNYKRDGKWEKIDNILKSVNPPAPAADFFQTITNTAPKPEAPSTFNAKAGVLDVSMQPLSQGLHLSVNGKNFVIKPVGANNSKPEKKNDTTVVYKNAWNGVDLEYEVQGELLKENIIVKDKNAATTYEFKVSGAKLIDDPKHPGLYTIEGAGEDYRFGELSIALNDRGAIKEQHATQQKTAQNSITVTLDKQWLAEQPAGAFPIAIDPSFGKWDENGSDWMFKSDGYSCQGDRCWIQAGTLYDNGWKHWRSYVRFPYGELAGKTVLHANIHGYYNPNANPDPNQRYLYFGNANCIGWECRGTHLSTVLTAGDFDVNITNRLQERVNAGDMGAVWSMWGEEVPYKTFKTYSDMSLWVEYDSPTPASAQQSPANGEVIVGTQPILKGSTVSDPDGPAQYYFTVSTNSNATSGAVINSGWIDTPQWTIPDGILQDGTTYYWKIKTKDTTSTGRETDGPVRSFKVDLRSGKDATQMYDTVGPVGVNLATGNATVENSSHTMSALGGSMGVNLSYDTPNRARKGLKAEYWNIASNYNFAAGAPTSTPGAVRIDPDVNFDWSTASPDNRIGADHWYTRWTGNMTVPATGAYTFGASNDDDYAVYINGIKVAGSGCCSGPATYANATSVNLTAGQVVDVRVDYHEYGGAAYMKLFVKGPVDEQVVPREWLNTDDPNGSQLYGLTGRYYTDNANAHDLDAAASDPMRLMLARQDTKMNLDFGSGGPAPNMQGDNFMARWTGYITVPAGGDYQIGAYSDNGLRIKLNNGLLGAQNTLVDQWNDQWTMRWSGNTHIDGNVPVPITIDWYEGNGGAAMKLYVRGNGFAEQEVPVSWLTPKASALPDGWQLNLDVDGNVAYERLRVSGSSVILEDSSRQTHTYISTGSGFKPPVNEDGTLVKNADNTYTLTDVDGRVYIFDAEGKLKSVTTPADDRQPAALKYEYGNDPSRLLRIVDGVNSARYATLHYKGIQDDNMCGHPGGFDDAPNGMLCALKTSDGDVTRFYYQAGRLARVEKPGNDLTDYRYNTKGQIDTIRDGLASDVISAGLRTDDETVTTKLSYDSLGRIIAVKAPAATTGAVRLEHTFTYKPGDTVALNRLHRPSGPTNHILTSSTQLVNSQYDWMNIVHALRAQAPGTHAVYSCKRSDGTRYATARQDCHITQNVNVGIIGYLYDNPTGTATVAMARIRAADGYVLEYSAASLAGWTTEEVLGYGYATSQSSGVSEMHITSAPEPQGFSKRLAYDTLLRTNKVTDLTGKSTTTEWDSVKDIQLSTTDATGLKSTTIYDINDRPIDSYGPAPAEWYGSDRKPTTAYVNQVPHTSTGYDEGIKGFSVGWYNLKSANMTMFGAPKVNQTGYSSPADPSFSNPAHTRLDYRNHPLPMAPDTSISGVDGYGVRAIGKITFPATATYTFKAWADDSIRFSVDDQVLINNWGTKTEGTAQNTYTATFAATAGKSYRISVEYGHVGTPGAFDIWMAGSGVPDQSGSGLGMRDWSAYLKPGYNLTTSTKAYDSQLGDIESKTVYKDPAYGQIEKTVLDQAGINYESKATYETPGVGFLRQTSKTLPGGATTSYFHYGANDTADNPCTAGVEAFRQAGRPKGKAEPDPDGTGPQVSRTSETIYNESGDVVATRYNADPWTCTQYDVRGRVTQTAVPVVNGKPGRTIMNNYAVGGNPLITATTDGSGTITIESDLLGRGLKYTDAKGKVTQSAYDNFGKLTSRTSILGTESYEYDTYDRPVVYKLDGVDFATIVYDQFNRISSVQYRDGVSLEPAQRDTLGRVNKVTYKASGQYITDEIQHSVSGIVLSGTENGVAKNYTYDKASRLTAATIGANTFSYEFGAQDASCAVNAGANPNAAKDSNRTKLTKNGQVTTYCYDFADRLIASSDARFKDAIYDSHGNTVSLGDTAHRTQFSYDSGDRNIGITEIGAITKTVEYTRDVSDRIIGRVSKENSVKISDETHVYNGSGSSPSAILNLDGSVRFKYISLPGGVSLKINPASTSAGVKTYSLSNLHGDVMATINADGMVTGKFITGPFGESLSNAALPQNATTGTTYSYVGRHQKITESGLSTGVIQMGARVYVPELGRFLQVDPVEGGTLNSYVYAMDPVNQHDLSGKCAFLTPLCIAAVGMLLRAVAVSAVRIAVPAVVGLGPIRGPMRPPALSTPLLRPQIPYRPGPLASRPLPAFTVNQQVAERLRQIRIGQGAQQGYRDPHPYKNITFPRLPEGGNYTTYDVYPKSNFSPSNLNRGRIVHDSNSGRSWYTEHYDDGWTEIH